jgi:hypothetical protein
MGLIGQALNVAANIGFGAAKATLSSNVAVRTGAWALGGGIAGYATSPSESPTGIFYDVLRGATMGAGASVAAGAAIQGMKRIPSALTKENMRSVWNMSKGVGGAAAAVGGFAMRHPFVTAGAVGGGYLAMNSPGMGSPTLEGAVVNMKYDQQAMAAQELMTGVAPTGNIGAAPQMMGPWHRTLQQSTHGLVQGMHSSRHGG